MAECSDSLVTNNENIQKQSAVQVQEGNTEESEIEKGINIQRK